MSEGKQGKRACLFVELDPFSSIFPQSPSSIDYLCTYLKLASIYFEIVDINADVYSHNPIALSVFSKLKPLVQNATLWPSAISSVPKVFDEKEIADSLLSVLEKPHLLFGTSTRVTASIGFACTQNDDFNTLCRKADMAMFQSKQSGKNSYHKYSKQLEHDYMKKLNIINGLKSALRDNLLELHYQPKIDLETKKVISVEALVRWFKKNPMNYTPAQFVEVIESTEQIHDIGLWIIQQACHDCKLWHEEGYFISVAVNVSAKQLSKEGFSQQVEHILKTIGLNRPGYLEIELTERFIIRKNDIVTKELASLKKLGISIAIDDFGTGYSNMSYLTTLKVDVLKLDQCFVRQLDKNNKRAKSVIKAITGVAKVLGISVVAEGIETERDLKRLKDMGCQIGQGYFWSKPTSGAELGAFLKRHYLCA